MFAVVLGYVLIMALKLQRLEREVDALAARGAAAPAGEEDTEREPARVG